MKMHGQDECALTKMDVVRVEGGLHALFTTISPSARYIGHMSESLCCHVCSMCRSSLLSAGADIDRLTYDYGAWVPNLSKSHSDPFRSLERNNYIPNSPRALVSAILGTADEPLDSHYHCVR